jgi:hypothetical protein
VRHVTATSAVCLACAAFIASAARQAHAQSDTVEGTHRALALEASYDDDSTLRLRWSMFGQLSGIGETDVDGDRLVGSAAVGAELRLHAPECDLVRLGGLARGSVDRGGTTRSAEQWASFCIHLGPPEMATTMEVGHRLEWDVVPSLSAPLYLRAGPNRRETITIDATWVRIDPSSLSSEIHARGDFTFFPVNARTSFVWGADRPLSFDAEATAYLFRWRLARTAPWGEERDLVVDLFGGGGQFGDEAAAVQAWFLRLCNVRFGRVFASAGIGIGGGAAGAFVSELEREIDITRPEAFVAVETGAAHVSASLRGAHGVRIVPDGYLVEDSRVDGGIALHAGGVSAALDGFLARSTLYVPGAAPVSAATGGGSLTVTKPLARGAELALYVDGGRSFYADPREGRSFDELVASPRWAGRVLAVLSATIGSR